MRNIIGNPAEGADFFDRPKKLSKLRRELDNLANILLVAPRRFGKTSLALRLCEETTREHKRKAVFLNVEGRSDELAFAEKLIDELSERINWSGAYNFTDGECFIWAQGACNKQSTAEFLRRVDEHVQKKGRRLVVIWDG